MKSAAVCLALLLSVITARADAQNLAAPSTEASPVPPGMRAHQQTAANTIVFDHFNLRPVQADPMVLRLADGDYFQVRLINTDNTLFTYSISALPDEDTPQTTLGPTGVGLVATRFVETAVTMRHSQAFARYRVRIAPRADLAGTAPAVVATDAVGAVVPAPKSEGRPVLYPAVFDVWVETKPGFEVTFTGGAVFSGLRSPKYHTKTNTKGTADTADDVKTIERDDDARDDFWPDTVAIANFRHPEKFRGIGLATGVGLNNNAEPRFFIGPSYFLGRNLLLTAGWLGGTVDRLPTGQKVGEAPVNGDSTLTSLPKRFKNTFYVGFAFSFIPKSEDSFKGAFGAAQKTTAVPAAAPATTTPTGPGKTPMTEMTPAAVAGSYSGEGDKKAVVAANGDTKINVTLPDAAVATMERLGAVYSAAGAGANASCAFELSDDKKTLTMTCTRDGKEQFKGKRTVAP